MDKFQDIMPNEILLIDFTKYIYVFICIFVFILVFMILIKRFNKKEKVVFTKEQIALKNLKNLDFNTPNQKQLLYDFTLLAKECQNEKTNEKTKEKLDDILKKIEPFKYQKYEIVLDENIKKILKEYINDLVI